MNDNKVTPDPLTVFKKHAKMSWPWEWTEDYGALNYGEFKKIWTKHVLPLQKELLELKAWLTAERECSRLCHEGMTTAEKRGIDKGIEERDALKAELSEAKKENDELSLKIQVDTTNNQIIEELLSEAKELMRQITSETEASWEIRCKIESFLSESKI